MHWSIPVSARCLEALHIQLNILEGVTHTAPICTYNYVYAYMHQNMQKLKAT